MPEARKVLSLIDSEGNLVHIDGYYAITKMFMLSTWNCPDFPVGHSLNEELQGDSKISWCGEPWKPAPEVEKSAGGKPSAICLDCVEAYEKYHFGS